MIYIRPQKLFIIVCRMSSYFIMQTEHIMSSCKDIELHQTLKEYTINNNIYRLKTMLKSPCNTQYLNDSVEKQEILYNYVVKMFIYSFLNWEINNKYAEK